jgi:hypothetical protein
VPESFIEETCRCRRLQGSSSVKTQSKRKLAKGNQVSFLFYLLNDDSLFYGELDELSICPYAEILHDAVLVKCYRPRSNF